MGPTGHPSPERYSDNQQDQPATDKEQIDPHSIPVSFSIACWRYRQSGSAPNGCKT
jgi:hypothetical protein